MYRFSFQLSRCLHPCSKVHPCLHFSFCKISACDPMLARNPFASPSPGIRLASLTKCKLNKDFCPEPGKLVGKELSLSGRAPVLHKIGLPTFQDWHGISRWLKQYWKFYQGLPELTMLHYVGGKRSSKKKISKSELATVNLFYSILLFFPKSNQSNPHAECIRFNLWHLQVELGDTLFWSPEKLPIINVDNTEGAIHNRLRRPNVTSVDAGMSTGAALMLV